MIRCWKFYTTKNNSKRVFSCLSFGLTPSPTLYPGGCLQVLVDVKITLQWSQNAVDREKLILLHC